MLQRCDNMLQGIGTEGDVGCAASCTTVRAGATQYTPGSDWAAPAQPPRPEGAQHGARPACAARVLGVDCERVGLGECAAHVGRAQRNSAGAPADASVPA
jgi:hypothetical protein